MSETTTEDLTDDLLRATMAYLPKVEEIFLRCICKRWYGALDPKAKGEWTFYTDDTVARFFIHVRGELVESGLLLFF